MIKLIKMNCEYYMWKKKKNLGRKNIPRPLAQISRKQVMWIRVILTIPQPRTFVGLVVNDTNV